MTCAPIARAHSLHCTGLRSFEEQYHTAEFALLNIIYPQTPRYGTRFFFLSKTQDFSCFSLQLFLRKSKNQGTRFFSYSKTHTKQQKTVKKVENILQRMSRKLYLFFLHFICKNIKYAQGNEHPTPVRYTVFHGFLRMFHFFLADTVRFSAFRFLFQL